MNIFIFLTLKLIFNPYFLGPISGSLVGYMGIVGFFISSVIESEEIKRPCVIEVGLRYIRNFNFEEVTLV